MKYLFTIITFLIFNSFCFSQISTSVLPQSIQNETLWENIEDLPMQDLPNFEKERILEEDKNTVNSNRFAAPLSVNLNLNNSGKWINLKNGDRVWVLKIKAKDALSLHVLYDNFNLPKGATLHIYNDDKSTILGAFTSINNKEDGKFTTGIIKGNHLILEYYEPNHKKGQGIISINRIDYGYRSTLEKKSTNKKTNDFGDSGSCNVNINCTAGNNWQDEKKGVVRILVVTSTGSGWCTGSLINNTNNNGTPYVLSAFHCQDGGIPSYSQWTFYFNYEAVGCSNPSSQPTIQSIVGATEKSKYNPSDFLLVELTNSIPAAYNPYYNGWDKSTTIPNNSTSIHHPAGDIKKIAVDNQSPVISGYSGASGSTHWEVVWNTGTTEGGSSGSALFNASGQIIGQLHGGGASCFNLTSPDYYGRFNQSWTGGGTNSTRLSNWLDPTSSGVATLNGSNGSGTGGTGSPNLDKVADNISITGNSVAVSATVENNGTAAAGIFNVRFYASTNTIISTGDTEIYTATVNSLAVNANAVISQTINLCTLPALTNNSTYYFGYIIDYANTVAESDETDNTWAWTTSSMTLNCVSGCISASQYPNTTFTPTTTWQTAATNIYAGEYSVYNVVAGTTYEWSLCATDGGNVTYDSEMTLTDASNNNLDYNNDFCGTASKIAWTSTLTGTVRLHITENSCQSNSTNTTLVYQQQVSGCISTSQYPNTTFTPTTSWQTAATNIYAGEYSVYNVVAGTTYEWSLCAADGGSVTYDSEITLTDASNNILDYNNDFCGTASKITWTSTLTGTVRVHISENSCQSNSTNTTLVYQQQGVSLPNLDNQTGNITFNGNNVSVNVTIENNGTAAAGAFDVRFYASTNTIISTADIEIYTASISSLAANGSSNITQTIDLCSNALLNGTATYYIGYIIDYTNVITESDETDNTWSLATPTTLSCFNGCVGTSQYPNTTFTPTTTWQTTATNIYAGEYSVYNVVAGTTYEWSLCAVDGGSVTYDSEMTLTTATNGLLDSNDDFCGTASKITWTSTLTGTVRVHISESPCVSNSTNTTLVYKQQGSSTLPNLTAINTTSISMNTNTATITFDMENNGGAAAGAFDVRFYASTNTTITTFDTEVGLEAYTGLAANTTNSRTVIIDLCSITGFTPSGNYYIGFLIDEPSQVTESDETDNTSYFTTAVPLNCTVIPTYTITTSSNPTLGGTTTGGGTFNSGQMATLVATANTGWFFNGWSENGNTVSNNPTYTFSVTANRNLVAEFSQQIVDITTTSNPAIGGTTSGGGNVPYNQSVTVIATPNAGWNFDAWTENGTTVSTNTSYTFNAITSRNLVAEFSQQQFTITTNTNPTTGGTATGGGILNYNQDAILVATPNTGWNFDGWSENGNIVSTNATYIFSVLANRNLVAEFSQQQFTITTNANPTAGGTTTGDGTYTYLQNATLVATPNAGWNFDGWSLNGNIVNTNATYTLAITASATLVAEFSQQQFTITTNANPTAGGTTTGDGTYTYLQNATLVATANAGWNFDGWSLNGNIVNTNATYTLAITASATLVAEFSEQQFTITIDADSLQGGSVSGGGIFGYNQQATVAAAPNPNWLFEGWYENNVLVSNSPTYTFTVVNDRDLMANFDFDVNTNSIVQDADLSIYPNPATDLININIEHQTLVFNEIHVYNLQGQLVKTANLNANNNTIVDLDNLSAGTYLVQIFTLDKSQFVIQKVIKTE